MRMVILAAALVFALAGAAFATAPVAVVTTVDGQTFKQVTVFKVVGDDVLLLHSEGSTKVPLRNLSDETRKSLGLRTRSEQAAFEKEQKSKGLVETADGWVTLAQKARLEAPFLTYNGKARTEAWFSEQYERFKTSIVCADGKFVDIGSALVGKAVAMQPGPPERGKEVRYIRESLGGTGQLGWQDQTASVYEILDKKTCLLKIEGLAAGITPVNNSLEAVSQEVPGYVSWVICLKEFDTTGLTDGVALNAFSEKGRLLVYVGPFRRYNGGRTWPCYMPLRSLTKDEFKQCLQGGFPLVEYAPGPQGPVGTPVQ